MAHGEVQTDWNFLGLEIGEPLVEEANLWRDEKGLTNLHYLFCNANSSLEPILETFSAGSLQRISIQFPIRGLEKAPQTAGGAAGIS